VKKKSSGSRCIRYEILQTTYNCKVLPVKANILLLLSIQDLIELNKEIEYHLGLSGLELKRESCSHHTGTA